MDLKELASELIQAVGGELTDDHKKLVLSTFEGIVLGTNSNWEQHLASQTNDALMQDNLKCPGCNTKIRLTRTRHAIYSDLIQ